MAGGDLAQDTRNAAVTLNAISMRTNKGSRGSNKVLSLSISSVSQYFYLYWYSRSSLFVHGCPVMLECMMNEMTEKAH